MKRAALEIASAVFWALALMAVVITCAICAHGCVSPRRVAALEEEQRTLHNRVVILEALRDDPNALDPYAAMNSPQ